jgi:hypothetical protein
MNLRDVTRAPIAATLTSDVSPTMQIRLFLLRLSSPACVMTVACLLPLMGCSGSDLGAEVSGVASLDGRPLESGSVVFAPVDGVSNNATSAVNSDGTYQLVSNRTIGLTPGKYRVAVTMHEHVDVKPGERSMVMPKLLTPEKYADPSTSGLEFDVAAGSNTINIELTSK